jgi:hypothetical protein
MPPVHDTTNGDGRAEKNGKAHDYRPLFGKLGVVLGAPNGSGEAVAEECPYCGSDRFYLNVTEGLWDCKKCDESGNVTTFLTWVHAHHLAKTTADHYLALKAKRGIASQTLKLHELAYDDDNRRWLIPFKNAKGNVINLQLYYPDRPKGVPNKENLPGLPTAIYGFDRLVKADVERPVFLCEGPFDAIAADYNIGHAHRAKYVIVATPGAFKEEWAEHFKGRKVRALYDNDDGGRKHGERVRKLLGESGVAAELKVLKWPDGTPDGYDINDLVRDNPRVKLPGFVAKHSFAVAAEPKLAWSHGWERKDTEPEVIDWIWPDHIPCGTYVSFSGKGGVLKSTIIRELIARYTKGEAMPTCDRVELPAGHVIYITAEDGEKKAWTELDRAGADGGKVSVLPALTRDGDTLNVLDCLGELEQAIKEHSTRLVVIDGQNSVVGAPCIATDMLARHNVTNKLHYFAQRLNIALIGLRNEDQEGRAYGPASMGDQGRCVMRAEEDETPAKDGQRYFRLIFKKVSDAAPETHPPIPYSVENLGGSSRRILWGKSRPRPTLTAADRAAAEAADAEEQRPSDSELESSWAAELAEYERERLDDSEFETTFETERPDPSELEIVDESDYGGFGQ